jgi:hypothetical protein
MYYMAAERTRIVTIRFTEAEYEKLLSDARGEKLSKFIRRRLIVIRRPNSAIMNLEQARKFVSKAMDDLDNLKQRLQMVESDIRNGDA